MRIKLGDVKFVRFVLNAQKVSGVDMWGSWSVGSVSSGNSQPLLAAIHFMVE